MLPSCPHISGRSAAASHSPAALLAVCLSVSLSVNLSVCLSSCLLPFLPTCSPVFLPSFLFLLSWLFPWLSYAQCGPMSCYPCAYPVCSFIHSSFIHAFDFQVFWVLASSLLSTLNPSRQDLPAQELHQAATASLAQNTEGGTTSTIPAASLVAMQTCQVSILAGSTTLEPTAQVQVKTTNCPTASHRQQLTI